MERFIEGVVMETTGNIAQVRASKHSECEHCGICAGTNAVILDVIDGVGVKRGQRVLIENKLTNKILVAFMIYMVPILAVGCGIFLGYYLSLRVTIPAFLLMILGGLIFGLPVMYLLKHLDRSLKAEKPVIIRIIK
ncbi:MAG: SoxR reducing system RseC family protein [Syntrophaceticus sp.]|nr:SoxR reducing system RseC family protein [Syntrophaceticus sp.]MDD4359522.1 SoxR reducing system RseC family protein [Syntrophaceticus sp.]